MVANGSTYTHFVKYSIAMTINLTHPSASGNGPTRLIPYWWNDCGLVMLIMLDDGSHVLNSWHSMHLVVNVCASMFTSYK